MNWKEEATEKLRKYDAMRLSTQNLPEELQRLEQAACAIRSARVDGTPVRGGTNRREDMLLSNLVCREELSRALTQAKLWVSATDRALGALSPEEKLILRRMYIYPERNAVERLCGELDLEQSSIYRKRDQALHRFTTALYGIPN
jgi:transposase-like protein